MLARSVGVSPEHRRSVSLGPVARGERRPGGSPSPTPARPLLRLPAAPPQFPGATELATRRGGDTAERIEVWGSLVDSALLFLGSRRVCHRFCYSGWRCNGVRVLLTGLCVP